MWLLNSSIGKKVVMSLTGLFLILFLTFHMSMNLVAIFSEEGYNMVCEFLGANWYALAGTAVIAAGAVLHILFALWLTYINRRARGKDRYKVTEKPKDVEWASQNMLVLGIIVVIGIAMHLYQFWFKILSWPSSIWYGSLLFGSTSHMAFGAPFRHWVGTIKFGCRAGNVSPTSTQPFFASDLLW